MTEHKGKVRKWVSFLSAGAIGYVIAGRDKTKKTKVKGTILITNKAIYCTGNVYPYDQLILITKRRRSILLTLDKNINGEKFTVRLELSLKDKNNLMRGLEMARTSHLY